MVHLRFFAHRPPYFLGRGRWWGAVILFMLLFILCTTLSAQIVPVGSGGYTTNFPGVDPANRNTYPTGTPVVSGIAATKPVPTNDWWSAKIKNDHASNLFSYPYTLKTVNAGLVVSYIPWGVIDDLLPVTMGVTGLNATKSTVCDFSDWTVTMDWNDGAHDFQATAGIGMPFLYFSKKATDVAQVTIASGTVTISNEMLVIVNAKNGADFAVYAPVGSTWIQNGGVYTSTLNGKNYWSMAFIPLTATNVSAVANEYKKYAYVFPVNTTATWNYNAGTSVLRTDFTVETDVKEGTSSKMLLGLLPHQWTNLASNSPAPGGYSYATVRGELKTLEGNAFSVENTFHGILPTLPYLDNYSNGFSPSALNEKIQLLENEGLSTWTDSYNEGQVMNRLIQTARIADLTGNTTARDKIVATIKERLEDWLKAEAGEVAFLFYYNSAWSAMIGYPAGHGQDGNLNDHHFHWGYFIHAAAFMEQFQPGWAGQWGDMVNYLVRDAACSSRSDNMFPFLRNFSPYAGHCWANGFATFPQGNDQESTSESMQFNSSLIHWGTVTGNNEIRDLGIYLYTTEQTAIEEYWFDMYERNFQPTQQYSLVSRVWGNSYDNGTFWTNDIAASYGIEMYPIHGGSLYLGQNLTYVQKLWNEITVNTGILTNQANDNLWHDIMWEYLAFIDPQAAIDLYDSYPGRSLKFGVSDAQTYHWLHSMNSLGQVNSNVTADYPVAAAFTKNGQITYVAHNYLNNPITVTFSDGYALPVPAHKMATSRDISISGVLASSFPQAYANGSVELHATVSGGAATKVEFFDGENLIGEDLQMPYVFNAVNLNVGKHGFYARIYQGTEFNVTNITPVMVGRQLPFNGSAIAIPGTIQSGWFDKFEGGNGQGISYSDVSTKNEGGFRPDEYVDASMDAAEGAVVGWISTGEWLEYSIDVETPGYYDLTFRYACNNTSGGGPFHLESDGQAIGNAITVTSTGGWATWTNKTVNNIPLKKGEQILKLGFANGELNLGKMTFAYKSPLSYDQPVADAGANVIVVMPGNSTMLNGSNSSDPGGMPLSYQWTQVYGPSVVSFSDDQITKPVVSPLIKGVYAIRLTVSNGSHSDDDEMFVIVSDEANIPPTVSIVSPVDQAEFTEGKQFTIAAAASDLNGTVLKVDFFADGNKIGTATGEPFSIKWSSAIGEYSLTAVATDDGGSSATSQAVTIKINKAPSCRGSAFNGDFDFLFSADASNPTITFLPSVTGVGSPTCILYYGTNASSLPGYPVAPNTPYRMTAAEGSTIWFYYTYSYPGQGEKNTSEHKNSYEIGSCGINGIETPLGNSVFSFYPNPVSDKLHLKLPEGKNILRVYDFTGQKIAHFTLSASSFDYGMEGLTPGIYILEIINGDRCVKGKVVKR